MMRTCSQLCILLVCVSCFLCTCKDENKVGNEEYNQSIHFDTNATEQEANLPKKQRNSASADEIESSQLVFGFNNAVADQECRIDEMFYELQENSDGTVQLELIINGVADETEDFITYCYFVATVPWNPDGTMKLPYTWTYLERHLQSDSKAEYHARTDTRLVLAKEQKGNPENYKTIYPVNSGAVDDPPNVAITGTTTVYAGTEASFGSDVHLWMSSEFTEADRSGNTVVVKFNMRREQDTATTDTEIPESKNAY